MERRLHVAAHPSKGTIMSLAARINLFTHAPSALKAMVNLSQTVKQGALGPRLVELVNLRVSQQNG
jgi:hypothetical protein